MGATASKMQMIRQAKEDIRRLEMEVDELMERYKALPFGDLMRRPLLISVNFKRMSISSKKGMINNLRNGRPTHGMPNDTVSMPLNTSTRNHY